MIKKLWIDIETSGLDHNNESIVQLVAIYAEDDKIIDSFSIYAHPDKFTNNFEQASKIHGLTKEFVLENGVDETDLYINFIKFLDKHIGKYIKGDRAILAGSRSEFDYLFIKELFSRANDDGFYSYFYTVPFDINQLALTCVNFGLMDPPTNYKLQTLCSALGVGIGNAHNAEDDIIATIKIYKKLKKLLKDYNGN